MKILEKIDEQLNLFDLQKQIGIHENRISEAKWDLYVKGKKANKKPMSKKEMEDMEEKFLKMGKKDVRSEIVSEGKVGGKEYDDFFKEMLKKYKVKSYKDLPKDKQTKFFDDVDKSWDTKVEKGQTSKKYRKGQSSMAD